GPHPGDRRRPGGALDHPPRGAGRRARRHRGGEWGRGAAAVRGGAGRAGDHRHPDARRRGDRDDHRAPARAPRAPDPRDLGGEPRHRARGGAGQRRPARRHRGAGQAVRDRPAARDGERAPPPGRRGL
ncbi:MAG: hypothetical protein AVDCRST_MAG40-1952, partial [uncultured Gemmatimonadaceae bacterium]